MEESKQTYKLPEGWIEVKLDDISKQITDGSHNPPKDVDDGIPMLSAKNIENNNITFEDVRYISKDDFEYENQRTKIEKGDVLLTIVATIGRTAVVSKNAEFTLQRSVAAIKPLIRSKYLMYCFQSPLFQQQLFNNAKGTAQKGVYLKTLRNLNVPLAPLLEQHRIVSKIESLFSELDQAEKGLKIAQQQLEVYKQALLKSAFEGKLTKQWRMEVNPVTSEKLLNQIEKERQKRYEQDIIAWKKLVERWEMDGEKENKPDKPFKLNGLPDFEESELNEYSKLPPEWIWTKIDRLIEYDKYAIKAGPFGSSLKKQFYVKNGYKIYGQEQVIADDAQLGDYYINEEKYNELISCKVKPSDILISLVGTVGKVLILPENCEKGIINPRLLKLSLDTSYYLPKIFKFYFESLFLKKLYSTHTHGATMNVLNLGIVQKLPFPFMSIDEQMIIVKKLESQFSIIDKLEQTIDLSIKKVKIYRHSILKKAYTGKLTSQDTNDEKAYELLKKIKKEKTEYLKSQKELDKLKPKKKRQMEKKKTILEILESSDKPIASKELWKQSVHHDDIEAFYNELKEIYHRLSEIKENTESFLTLEK